jgi:2-oxo-3-hexenedioate decarboxylase
MKQMGVSAPVLGFLVDSYAVPDGGVCATDRLIHPKVEPAICFVTRTALRGPGCHIGAVLAATEFVMPSIEVIDSRYRDFRFDLKSVVADNCSSARFVVGGRARPAAELDLRSLGVVFERNGKSWHSALAQPYWGIRQQQLHCSPITWGPAGKRSRRGA